MNFFHRSTNDPLTINKYGIPEPISDRKILPQILFVPLVAYDKNFNRIGYGGGFYDRYIKKNFKKKKSYYYWIGIFIPKSKKNSNK